MNIRSKLLMASMLAFTGIVASAQAQSTSAATKPSTAMAWWGPYLETDALAKVVLVASLIVAYVAGYFVFGRLLTKYSPSTAGRFGCFWGVVAWFIYHVLIAVFYIHVQIPAWIYGSIALGLIALLIVLTITKRSTAHGM